MKWKMQCYKKENMKFRYLIPMQIATFFTGGFDTQATNAILPEIQKEMNIDISVSQWVQTVGTIAKASFSIPLAQLGAKIGVINSLLFFTIIQTALFPTLIFVKNFYGFIAIRFFLGLAMCGAQVNTSTVYQRLPKEEDRKKYAEYAQITMNTARLFGPIICTSIIQWIGWRYVYVVTAVASFYRFLNTSFIYNFEMQKKEFDVIGAIVIVVFLACLTCSLTCLAQYQYIAFGVLFGISVISFIILVYVEGKVKNPLVDIKILKKPVPDLIAINSCQIMVQSGEQILAPQYFDHYQIQSFIYGVTNTSRLILNLFTVVTSVMIHRKYKLKLHVMLLIGYSLTFLFSLVQTTTTNIKESFISIFVFKQIFVALGNQQLNPTILTSVHSSLIHKINGLSTTLSQLSQCISQCFFTMVMKLCQDRKDFNFGILIDYVILTMIMFINLIQITVKLILCKKDSQIEKKDDEEQQLMNGQAEQNEKDPLIDKEKLDNNDVVQIDVDENQEIKDEKKVE